MPGVDLRLGQQVALLDELGPALARWPYGDEAGRRGLRYQTDNDFFGWTDSQLWYALLATRRPRRVVEVGSGWSTALLLDACDREGLETTVTAIEPFPERLRSVMRDGDADRITVRQHKVQDMPADELADLHAGDVLFVDSTHVAKIGSDVNHLVFDVFPRLPPGVLVHVHDIAYPFEYPQEWVEEGRAWNEAYLLRAFLLETRGGASRLALVAVAARAGADAPGSRPGHGGGRRQHLAGDGLTLPSPPCHVPQTQT